MGEGGPGAGAVFPISFRYTNMLANNELRTHVELHTGVTHTHGPKHKQSHAHTHVHHTLFKKNVYTDSGPTQDD